MCFVKVSSWSTLEGRKPAGWKGRWTVRPLLSEILGCSGQVVFIVFIAV